MALVAELGVFLLIWCVVQVNEARHWHARMVDFRLVAELMGKQQALAIVGTSLSITATRKVTAEPVEADPAGWIEHPSTEAGNPEKKSRWWLFRKNRPTGIHHTEGRQVESWAGWYFRALVRAAPLASGSLAEDLTAIRQAILASLIDGQKGYHQRNALLRERAAECMERVGEALFLIACLIIAGEIALNVVAKHDGYQPSGVSTALGILAVALPALSAALVGIKSFAELEVMAHQSRRMGQTMLLVERRLQALGSMNAPLASRELTAEVRYLAAEMLSDAAGWTQISRVKALGLN